MKYGQQKNGAETQSQIFNRKRSEIPTAERLQTLQEKLYQKAKQEPNYRFYVLYDKTFIPYMLQEARKKVRATNTAPGIDGQTIKDIEQYGVSQYLYEIGEELRNTN